MKNLITSASKVFKLSFAMVALAFAPVFAGGKEKIEIKKSDSATTYAEALTNMEAALNEQEAMQEMFTLAPQIKVYDSNFNLVKEAILPADGIIQDKEILGLVHRSGEFMKFENTTYYILNK